MLLKQNKLGISLRVFTRGLRVTWFVIAAATILLEVIPFPPTTDNRFYAYCAAKGILFVLLGYLAPLAFWAFSELNRGIAFAALSACCVETLQALIQNGHSFHWYELVIKLAVILLGFSLALNARYDQQISLGPIRVRLVEEHGRPVSQPRRRA
jgi:hypothetical protein